MPYGKMDSIKKHIISWRLSTLPLLCLCLSLVTLPQTSCAPSTPKPTQNITVTVPEGTQSHGNPNLLCTPTRWTNVAVFFLANYVAHAATVKSVPGEPALATIRLCTVALMFPVGRILRGIQAIMQRATFSNTPLETAAKAEALCVVIRTQEWLPQSGDIAHISGLRFPRQADSNVQNRFDRGNANNMPFYSIDATSTSFLPSNSIAEFYGRKVYGICCLPHGYALAILPRQARITEICKEERDEPEVTHISPWSERLQHSFITLRTTWLACFNDTDGVIEPIGPGSQEDDSLDPDSRPTIELSSNYNLPKGVIAIFQTLYASATLYRTRGDQIKRYGYASFGLTVAPYLIMSVINLLGTMLTPDYPCVYLVRSEIMDEASRRKGAKFEGMVATLRSEQRNPGDYVEFTLDENDRTFIRSPRELISQRGIYDANDVLQTQIYSLSAMLSQDLRRNDFTTRAQRLEARKEEEKVRQSFIVARGPGFTDDLPEYSSEYISLDTGTLIAGSIIGLVPTAIIGGLSHFDAGHSTIAQRVWTMTWLAFGWYMGIAIPYLRDLRGKMVATMVLFGAPAIGGFVVVGQMLRSYGSCIEIGGANI